MAAVKVQFGCGLSAPVEWANYDSSPALRLQRLPVIGALVPAGRFGRFPANVKYGDITLGLPLPSNHAALLYSSHVLEHLSLEDMRRALRNCHRVLQPRGIFRMVLPDLERLVKRYSDDSSSDACIRFMQDTLLGSKSRPRGLAAFLRDRLGNSRHLWMWDFKGLAKELADAGFLDIRRAYFGDSPAQDFRLVEAADRWTDALGIECRK